ncbi:MAG: hypothetical protein WC656_12085 [Sulfurimonas sp.]|jgi:hypothetical protein
MGALTKQERDGLDEVFLSIHSHSDKYHNIKNIPYFIMSKGSAFSVSSFFKHAKHGLKATNISHFMAFLTKKKKCLSK